LRELNENFIRMTADDDDDDERRVFLNGTLAFAYI